MKIKRWNYGMGCECGRINLDVMYEDDDGEYVLYKDVEGLLDDATNKIKSEISQLEADKAELVEALEKYMDIRKKQIALTESDVLYVGHSIEYHELIKAYDEIFNQLIQKHSKE